MQENPSNVVLVNVQIFLRSHPVDCLEVCNVKIRFNGESAYSDFLPTDPRFSKALFVANSMALVKGEVVSHLGLGHICTEQNAMAVYRTLRNNPLGLLLKPHLRGVMEINRRGDDLIFGAKGILKLTRLSLEGITQALQDVVRGICYTNFKPREPLNDLHKFARAEKLYWDIVSTVVDAFFVKNMSDIQKYWYEIIAMSRCLTEHSLEHRRWEGQPYQAWVSTNEIDQPEPGEKLKADDSREGQAVRPIVRFPNDATPHQEDIERLKQYCRHTIFTATFWHWAVHKTQGVWGTNLKIASLAPRNLDEDPYRGTTVSDASEQMSLAHIFTNFQHGHAVDNIYGDIDEKLITLLKENKANFQALGFNISDMFGGVFI